MTQQFGSDPRSIRGLTYLCSIAYFCDHRTALLGPTHGANVPYPNLLSAFALNMVYYWLCLLYYWLCLLSNIKAIFVSMLI